MFLCQPYTLTDTLTSNFQPTKAKCAWKLLKIHCTYWQLTYCLLQENISVIINHIPVTQNMTSYFPCHTKLQVISPVTQNDKSFPCHINWSPVLGMSQSNHGAHWSLPMAFSISHTELSILITHLTCIYI